MNVQRSNVARKTVALSISIAFLLIGVSSPVGQGPGAPKRQVAGSQTVSPQFSGVDVVIVIDQSGSMSKRHWDLSGAQFPPNDPHARRIEAVWGAVSRLSQDVKGTNRLHRISVVEFGDNVSVPVSRMRIWDDPKAVGNDVFLQHIGINVAAKNMGNTDHIAALTRAADELQAMRNDPKTPPGHRAEFVLLITDGRSDTRTSRYFNRATGFNEALYRQDLQQKIPNLFKTGSLWVMAINDSGTSQYWDAGWGVVWQGLAGRQPAGQGQQSIERAELVPPNAQMGHYAGQVVDYWLGNPNPTPITDSYLCPPYLKAILFDVQLKKPADAGNIQIKDPNGVAIPHSKFKSMLGGRTVHIVQDDPVPGLWRVEGANPADVSIQVEQLYNNSILLNPVTEQGRGAPIEFRYRITDRNGQPFQFDPQYPVSAYVDVNDPAGAKTRVNLQPEPNGEFASDGQFVAAQIGDYDLVFGGQVTMKDATGKDATVEVFQSASPRVDRMIVSEKTPLILKLDQPEAGDPVSLYLGRGRLTIRGKLERADSPGIELDPSGVIDQPATLLFASVVDDRGAPLQAQQAMAYQDGEYRTEFKIKTPVLSWDWLLRRGKAAAVISVNPSALNSEFFIQQVVQTNPGKLPRSFSPLSTAWLPVRESILTFVVIPVLLVALIVGAIVLGNKIVQRRLLRQKDANLAPKLEFGNYDFPGYSREFPIAGMRRVKFKNQLVNLIEPIDSNNQWLIPFLSVERIEEISDKIARVRITYQPLGTKLKKERKPIEVSSRPGGEKVLSEFPSRHYYFKLKVREESK